MEVKLYVMDSDDDTNSSDVVKSHISSTIHPHNLEFEFEMVALAATNADDSRYTSLKDISPPPGLSRKESWREVPLKDPLIQQAAWAWAYLPLSNTEHQRSSFFGKFKHGFVGCFKNVILAIAGKLLSDQDHDIDDQEKRKNVD